MRRQAAAATFACVAAATLAASGARAAGITFGVRGGGGMSTFTGAGGVDPAFSYSVGGFMAIGLGSVDIQPELFLTRRGGSISTTESFNSAGDDIVISREETDSLTYLELPILVKKSGRTGYVFGGVSFGLLLEGTYEQSFTQTVNGVPAPGGSDSGDLDGADAFDFGLVVGGGARLRYMTVDARLSLGLQSIDSSRDVKNLAFSVMAGYHF